MAMPKIVCSYDGTNDFPLKYILVSCAKPADLPILQRPKSPLPEGIDPQITVILLFFNLI